MKMETPKKRPRRRRWEIFTLNEFQEKKNGDDSYTLEKLKVRERLGFDEGRSMSGSKC